VASETHDPSRWRELNLAWWEERAPIHEASLFYRSGGGGLEGFEWDDLASVEGLDVIHPQCHIGTDSISLAESGARVVGLDFSPNALDAARRLAAAADVAERTEWVTSDVYDSVEAVGGRQFDLVYTGKGALCWLPDMRRWAAVMWSLCKPGGRLYVSEMHPVKDMFADETTELERDYFPVGGTVYDDGAGSYADPDAATTNNVTVDFIHPVSEVIQALLDAGFVLESFREFPFSVYERWPFLEEREQGVWYMPDDRPQLPLLYSLRLRRPDSFGPV
jgi:SAM-dependent methyltransferase